MIGRPFFGLPRPRIFNAPQTQSLKVFNSPFNVNVIKIFKYVYLSRFMFMSAYIFVTLLQRSSSQVASQGWITSVGPSIQGRLTFRLPRYTQIKLSSIPFPIPTMRRLWLNMAWLGAEWTVYVILIPRSILLGISRSLVSTVKYHVIIADFLERKRESNQFLHTACIGRDGRPMSMLHMLREGPEEFGQLSTSTR